MAEGLPGAGVGKGMTAEGQQGCCQVARNVLKPKRLGTFAGGFYGV